jgi:hypothetical protein
LASLQGDHSQKSIMDFDMFGVKFHSSISSIVKDLTLQAIVGSRNIQISYGEMLDLYDLLYQGLTQLVPFFFSDQRTMIENQNPFTHLDLKLIVQTPWCYIHMLPLLELFDTGM